MKDTFGEGRKNNEQGGDNSNLQMTFLLIMQEFFTTKYSLKTIYNVLMRKQYCHPVPHLALLDKHQSVLFSRVLDRLSLL